LGDEDANDDDVVQVSAIGDMSGSKGEDDGEEKGESVTLWFIGKVKARGVGDTMDNVGGCGTSVTTSSAKGKVRTMVR
jgi:hypothetical protein